MKFARYVSVQIIAYGLDLGSFLIAFSYLLTGPITANIIGKVIAGTFAFFAHREFTFGVYKDAKRIWQAIRYSILLALNVPLSSGVLIALVGFIQNTTLAKVLSDVICVAITFTISKYFVFRQGN